MGNSLPAARHFFHSDNWRLETELCFNVHLKAFPFGKRIFCAQRIGNFNVADIGTTLRMTSHPNTPNTMFLQKSSFQNLQGIIKRPNRLINTATNNQNFINPSFSTVRSKQRSNLIRVFSDRAARWGTAFMPSLCSRFATATVSIGSDPEERLH